MKDVTDEEMAMGRGAWDAAERINILMVHDKQNVTEAILGAVIFAARSAVSLQNFSKEHFMDMARHMYDAAVDTENDKVRQTTRKGAS